MDSIPANILSVLISAWHSRISARTIARVKAAVVAVSLLLFVGIIGAMEQGTLSFGVGMLLGALVLIAEILCLRPTPKKEED